VPLGTLLPLGTIHVWVERPHEADEIRHDHGHDRCVVRLIRWTGVADVVWPKDGCCFEQMRHADPRLRIALVLYVVAVRETATGAEEVEDVVVGTDKGSFTVGLAGGGIPWGVVGKWGRGFVCGCGVLGKDGVGVVGGEFGVVVCEEVGHVLFASGVDGEDGALCLL